jgi:hypothetical protein
VCPDGSGVCCQVRIMGPNYVPGTKKDLYIKNVQRTVLCMGRRQDAVEDVPSGNTVAMVGLDTFIQKNATLTDEGCDDAHPIKVRACPGKWVELMYSDGKSCDRNAKGFRVGDRSRGVRPLSRAPVYPTSWTGWHAR